MQLTLMRSKLHRATVTEADLHYEGSISIDTDLLDKSGILINEQVDILNINNGERFTTYVIPAKAGSGEIKINGAGARKVQVGDSVIIVAYGIMDIEAAKKFKPNVVLLDLKNKIKK
jgi:aspartate 1-decarboxylase